MFTLPTFNLHVRINRRATGRAGGPDVAAMGNLAYGRRVANTSSSDQFTSGELGTGVVLLLPALTDVRGLICPGGPDFLEVPSGSGRWYISYHVEDIGKGFPNEHRAAVLVPNGPWPAPIP